MRYPNETVANFVGALASDAPAPGGGGAAALTAALGVSLLSMVAHFTKDRKKYAQYKTDLENLIQQCTEMNEALLLGMDEDEDKFLPLAKAYGLPKNTDEEIQHKEAVMEEALRTATETPLKVILLSCEAMELSAWLVDHSYKLVISDVGCAVSNLKSAILSAKLSAVININMMKDEAYREPLRQKMNAEIEKAIATADMVYEKTMQSI